MKRLLIALLLATAATAAYAACTTSTIWIDGRFLSCQTCCTGSHCNTTCF